MWQKKGTTFRDERKIRDICVENRKVPRRLITQLVNDAGIQISDRTTRRRVKELGFACRRPAKKPLLTPAMMVKRLKWAKTHRNWTVDYWKKVRFDFTFH